mgnify:CR=1 FL=1
MKFDEMLVHVSRQHGRYTQVYFLAFRSSIGEPKVIHLYDGIFHCIFSDTYTTEVPPGDDWYLYGGTCHPKFNKTYSRARTP